MEEKSFLDKAQEKLKEWTASLDELKDKLQSESAKTLDDFEDEKVKLKSWIDSATDKLKDAENISDEKMADLKNAFEDLKAKTIEKKAETEEALNEQHINLSKSLDKVKSFFSEAYKDSEKDVKHLSEKALDELEGFHTKFDMYKLRVKHMEKDAVGSWEEKKNELSKKIDELKSKVDASSDVAEDRWDDISKDLKSAWNDIRKAFKS